MRLPSRLALLPILLAALFFLSPALAQHPPTPAASAPAGTPETASPPPAVPGEPASPSATEPSPPPAAPPAGERRTAVEPVVTEHVMTVGGRELAYRAVAQTLPVIGRDGEPTADIFIVSYLLNDAPAERRPVTFVFNGGPGAASAYLHLGTMGPRVLATGPDGGMPPPPPELVENPATWLAFTDLVFIDPVGTGFSNPVDTGNDAFEPFFSVSGDIDSLTGIVRLWLSRFERWQSPKFLAGESYGGFRAVLMARQLLTEDGVAMNGLVLISPVLDFFTIMAEEHALLPWALVLPSMAASASAHGVGTADLDLDAVERWALGDYVAGLAAVAPPGPGPADAIIDELARLTGLNRELIVRHRGRIPASVFAKRLLADRGLVLSVYEGTIAGPDPAPAGRYVPDPVLDASIAPLSSAYNAYVRDALGVETEHPFRLLPRRPSRAWDWEGARGGPGGFEGVLDDLAETMALTPDLGVFVVHGLTDLVTPYMASRWMLDRLPLPEEVRANAELVVLDGGHMMYFRPDVRRRLGTLAEEFYARSLGHP